MYPAFHFRPSIYTILQETSFVNVVGKEENAAKVPAVFFSSSLPFGCFKLGFVQERERAKVDVECTDAQQTNTDYKSSALDTLCPVSQIKSVEKSCIWGCDFFPIWTV